MADPDSRTGKSRARKVSWLVLALIPVVALLGLLALRGPEDEGIEDTAAQSESPAAPSAPSAPITSDWPTLRGNAGRTGAVPGTGPAANPAVTWRFSPRSDIPMQGQPIVVGDTVYLPGSDFPGGLNALDAVTGEERWHASVGFFTDMENGGGGALIAADETTIYVAGTEGEAQCDCMPP